MTDEPKPQPVAPVAPVAPTVQQWQQTPPVQAQVQYVVAQKSLNGLGGWLMFWLIIFTLAGITYTATFFTGLGQGATNALGVTYLIFAPILAIAYLSSVVFIALRKKLGKLLAMVTIGLATLYMLITAIITMTSSDASANVSGSIGGMVVTLIAGGLMVLYFVTSKRVKATLVN